MAATSTALSRRADRHVYASGFRLRRGFVITIGNTVHGAGEDAATSARRRRLVTDHEDVHVWQGRWFGPLYPVLYVTWMVAGVLAGAVLWVVRGRRERFAGVVETCAYYLNPFEWWAYSRGGNVAAAQGRRARLAASGRRGALSDALTRRAVPGADAPHHLALTRRITWR